MLGLKIAATGFVIFVTGIALSERDAFGEDQTPMPVACAGIGGFALMIAGALIWIWGLA